LRWRDDDRARGVRIGGHPSRDARYPQVVVGPTRAWHLPGGNALGSPGPPTASGVGARSCGEGHGARVAALATVRTENSRPQNQPTGSEPKVHPRPLRRERPRPASAFAVACGVAGEATRRPAATPQTQPCSVGQNQRRLHRQAAPRLAESTPTRRIARARTPRRCPEGLRMMAEGVEDAAATTFTALTRTGLS
jgi:hypothetical protein